MGKKILKTKQTLRKQTCLQQFRRFSIGIVPKEVHLTGNPLENLTIRYPPTMFT